MESFVPGNQSIVNRKAHPETTRAVGFACQGQSQKGADGAVLTMIIESNSGSFVVFWGHFTSQGVKSRKDGIQFKLDAKESHSHFL
eukprot:scaffold2897_cov178-Amphora_coffeaeformis.AAC.24